MSTHLDAEHWRIGAGLAALLSGFVAVLAAITVHAASATAAQLALGGVALLVAGTLAVGTSRPGRTA